MHLGDLAKTLMFDKAGAGDEHVDPALVLGDFGIKTVEVGEIGDVALDSRHIAADFAHRLVEFLLAAAENEHMGALFDEELRRGKADSTIAAGDDGHFSL